MLTATSPPFHQYTVAPTQVRAEAAAIAPAGMAAAAATPAGAPAPVPLQATATAPAALPPAAATPAGLVGPLVPATAATVASTVTGLTEAQFREEREEAFRQALAQAAGVPVDFVRITGVRQVPAAAPANGKRRLAQAPAGALEVSADSHVAHVMCQKAPNPAYCPMNLKIPAHMTRGIAVNIGCRVFLIGITVNVLMWVGHERYTIRGSEQSLVHLLTRSQQRSRRQTPQRLRKSCRKLQAAEPSDRHSATRASTYCQR
jgi:hypothetical protein